LRILALAALLAAGALFALLLISFRARLRDQALHNLSRFAWFACYLTVVGVGLWYERASAAVLLAVPLAALSFVLVFRTIFDVPPPWLVVGIAFGLIFLLPLLIVVRERRYLRWP
jgi:hypothetical protein